MDDTATPPPTTYRFAGHVLDPGRGALYAPDGSEVALRPKSFDLLLHLARASGRVVGRDEMLEAVWPGVHVCDDAVTQCVREVRRAIGDTAHSIVRTVAKRGYILDAVRAEGAQGPCSAMAAAMEAPDAPSPPVFNGGAARLQSLPAAQVPALRASWDEHAEAALDQRGFYERMLAEQGFVPAWVSLLRSRANTVFAHGDAALLQMTRAPEQASAPAAAVVDTPPRDAQGAELTLQHRLEEALAAERAQVLADVNRHDARANVGLLLIWLGRADEAEPYFLTSLAVAPEHLCASGWQFALGEVELLLGRSDNGARRFRRFLNRRSDEPTLHLAAALALNGQTVEARHLVGEIRTRRPGTTVTVLRREPIAGAVDHSACHPRYHEQRERLFEGLQRAGLPE